MIRLPWLASLLCLLLAYVGVSPTFQADVDRTAVRQIPVSYWEYLSRLLGHLLISYM